MRLLTAAQGSEEWHNGRIGAITGSMFKDCCDRLKSGKNKGDFTAKAKQYAFRLACERISGQRLEEEQFETYSMRRGHELEPEARMLHEMEKGILVQQVGLALSDDGIYGASVDGIIEDSGISEYKCFISPASLMPILLERNIDDQLPQVQGGLWITEREYAHFCLYCPALEPVGKHLTIFEVERDQEYIDEMTEKLGSFNNLVNDYVGRLKESEAA